MIQTNPRLRTASGYSQVELITGFALVALLFLGLLYMVNPLASDEDPDGVPVYRAANAIYISNALERQRVAIMNYYDMRGVLPGDDPVPREIDGELVRGNEDGRITLESGESAKVFADLYAAGLNPVPQVRVRSKDLKVLWVRLGADGHVLREGNFFKLEGLNRLEALGMDSRYDDGRSDAGRILFIPGDDDTVVLYSELDLYR